MEVCRKSSWLFLLLGLLCLAATLQGVQGGVESEGPSESECRPYIEKALKELETAEAADQKSPGVLDGDSKEDLPTVEITTDDSDHEEDDGDIDDEEEGIESTENVDVEQEEVEEEEDEGESKEKEEEESTEEETEEILTPETEKIESGEEEEEEDADKAEEEEEEGEEEVAEESAEEEEEKSTEESAEIQKRSAEELEEEIEEKRSEEDEAKSAEELAESKESVEEEGEKSVEDTGSIEDVHDDGGSKEDVAEGEGDEDEAESEGSKEETADSKEDDGGSKEDETVNKEADEESKEVEKESVSEEEVANVAEEVDADSKEDKEEETEAKSTEGEEAETKSKEDETEITKSSEDGDAEAKSKEDEEEGTESKSKEDETETKSKEDETETKSREDEAETKSKEDETETKSKEDEDLESKSKEDEVAETKSKEDESKETSDESAPEEDLIDIEDMPAELRQTDHINQLLKLDEENSETEKIINSVAEVTLKELKKIYENAIKPLEVVYKYRDLSNRHFGDAEIFSKPLVVFMGPWSGGKSSIINYLVDNEYNDTSLKTGAEPSPAYFNILMHGEEPEVLDGTQLAADFTFSGLQKFGQGLEERLRGLKLPKKLLEKMNLVEIPGILEVRKQVSRLFPFNDACQWFIDRADIIFLVYDPSKLDVGPETEAILDQLKGREHQTRIVLNKADQVKPEELMRVQGALIWNISPLMSSAQPPLMYTTSLWSKPYEPWAPVRLLQAQERAFLRDLRSAIDKRIDNKIAGARRFAVRVRNHAKMVDCYLTTYYNHKSVFGNRKQVSDAIIEHPQDYHIYEGLSTLTNISRYDLPDPDVYRDFFRLNPLYEFQQLSATCTYFRGCPINRLDVAIAYDLPELVGKHKRMLEAALAEANQNQAQTPDS